MGGEGSGRKAEGGDWPRRAEEGNTWVGSKHPGRRGTQAEIGERVCGEGGCKQEMTDVGRQMRYKCRQQEWGAGGGTSVSRDSFMPALEEGRGIFNT